MNREVLNCLVFVKKKIEGFVLGQKAETQKGKCLCLG